MFDIILALGVGLGVGVIFTLCKLPLPSPTALAGVIGILGIFLGGQLGQKILDRFAPPDPPSTLHPPD